MEVVIFSQLGKIEEETGKEVPKFCEDRERYANNEYMIYE